MDLQLQPNKIQINASTKTNGSDDVIERSILVNVRCDDVTEACQLFNQIRLKLNGAQNINPVYETIAETRPSFSEQDTSGQTCPFCHSKLVMRHGQRGNFYGCSGYPKCKYTKPIEQ